MSLSLQILLTVSILPVFLIGKYIYEKDFQKEPSDLLTKLFIGGIGACFLVIIFSIITKLFFIDVSSSDMQKQGLIPLFLYVFLEIALIEEFCKWIFVYMISYNNNEFDELYDGIVYGAFVALGFACFENILYVLTGGIGIGIMRGLFAVPGHACDGVLMGYYLGLSKYYSLYNQNDQKKKYLILSLIVPTITHGIYDFILLTKNDLLYLLFLVYVVLMYIYIIKKIKKISSIRRKMKYKEYFCPNCGIKIESNFCPLCGRKND